MKKQKPRRKRRKVRQLEIRYEWNENTIERDLKMEEKLTKLLKKFGWEEQFQECDLQTKEAMLLYEQTLSKKGQKNQK